ncbi:MAG: DUF6492 family protein [Pseudomonadota bacterium]
MTKTNAIITASYAPDFERCQILCESIDRHASGYRCHYILVDAPDRDLFARLEGPKRKIITDVDLLPWWMMRMPKAVSPKGRRVWLSPLTMPMHGWHVQQIMRIAVAHMLEEDGLLYCDSDTAFVRDYDLNSIWDGDKIRLWAEPEGALTAQNDHMHWVDHAAQSLSITQNERVLDNFVCSFVTWRRQTVVDMCAHMEKVHGKSWVATVGSSRKFSECMLYGAYVNAVLGGADHWQTSSELCPMKWFNPAPSEAELADMVANLTPEAVGLGVQSFIPLSPDLFRQAVTTHLSEAA